MWQYTVHVTLFLIIYTFYAFSITIIIQIKTVSNTDPILLLLSYWLYSLKLKIEILNLSWLELGTKLVQRRKYWLFSMFKYHVCSKQKRLNIEYSISLLICPWFQSFNFREYKVNMQICSFNLHKLLHLSKLLSLSMRWKLSKLLKTNLFHICHIRSMSP